MTTEETLAACGGVARCGGETPHMRGVIQGVGVVWEDSKGSGMKCRTVDGRFLRGDKAKDVFDAKGEWAVAEEGEEE